MFSKDGISNINNLSDSWYKYLVIWIGFSLTIGYLSSILYLKQIDKKHEAISCI